MQSFKRQTIQRISTRFAFRFFLAASFFIAPLIAPAFAIALQDESTDSQTRTIGEYRQDLKTFMKLSKADDSQLERNAIFNLCQLHFEVVVDSRFETSQQLQGIRAVIAKRLDTYSKDEKNSRLREERDAKKSDDDSNSDASTATSASQSGLNDGDSDSSPVSDEPDDDNVNDDSYPGSTGSEHDNETGDAMYDSASESLFSMGALSGGPSQLFGYAGGRMAPPWDHGEELVDLITNVINPTFWRRNGGAGSIHYYQPSRVIVIRATQQGNEEAGDLLERLRANGGTNLNAAGQFGGIGN